MALKLRKEIKKSSYYVWFLGAKESKGLRGIEYIMPVVKHLEERERDVEPFKVTLQVSHKGLKIIQNVVANNANASNNSSGKQSKPKSETIKHFIPHNTITCVYQHEDVIACILLLFNPITKCPLHVHAYRCDSLETAALLKQQLQLLIDRPENQKKFGEIENRLKPSANGGIKEPNGSNSKKKIDSSVGSDTGTSTRDESESSGEERYGDGTRTAPVTTLYDSVAAELREKLGRNNVPILLPPRDYDTVHRQRGNLTGIELRRCLNANIVGQNVKSGAATTTSGGGGGVGAATRRIESSGGSSGIGSDHPPSPESPVDGDRYVGVDNQSTSDEEWTQNPSDSTFYLLNNPQQQQVTLPRPSRHNNNNTNSGGECEKLSPEPIKRDKHFGNFTRYQVAQQQQQQQSPNKPKKTNNINNNDEISTRFSSSSRPLDFAVGRYAEESINRRNRKEKNEFKDRYDDYGKEFARSKRADDDDIDDNAGEEYEVETDALDAKEAAIRCKGGYVDAETPRYYEDDAENDVDRQKYRRYCEPPVPKTRQKYVGDAKRYDERNFVVGSPQREQQRYVDEIKRKQMHVNEEIVNGRFGGGGGVRNAPESSRSYATDQRYYYEGRKNAPETRQRSPSSAVEDATPRDRFKDAKEKFLLLERERLEQERKLRYEEEREYEMNGKPRPAPRSNVYGASIAASSMEEIRYRRDGPIQQQPQQRYRGNGAHDKYDPKRRSMFSLIEEEHRRNSNEIAKELKRRSYMDNDVEHFYKDRSYQDLPESERYHPDNATPGGHHHQQQQQPQHHYHHQGQHQLEREYDYHHHHPQHVHISHHQQQQRCLAKSAIEIDKMGGIVEPYDAKYMKAQQQKASAASYRHSYAEPKMRVEQPAKKYNHHHNHPELLHRTNSSVSNSGRVGIASVHPY